MRKPLAPEDMDPEDLVDHCVEHDVRRRCMGSCRWHGFPRPAPTYRRDLVTGLGHFSLHICSVCHGIRTAEAAPEVGRP